MFIETSMGTSSKMYSSYETHITSSKVSSRVYTCNRFSPMAKYSQSFYSVEKRYIYIYSSFSSPCQWHHSPFILILQWLRPTFDPLCWPVSVMGKTAKKQVAVAPLRRLMGKSPPDGPKAKGMKPKKPLIQTKGVKDTKRKVKETLKESKTTTKKVEKPKGQVGKSGVSEPSQRRSALRKPVAKEPAEVAIQKVASEKDKRNKLSLLKKKLEEYKSKEEEEAEQSGSESCDMEKELESILEAKKSNKANKNEKKTEEEESEEDGEDEEDEEEVEQNTENQSTDEESEGDSAGDEEESSSAAESDQDEVEGEGAEGAEGGEGAEGEAGTDGEHPAPTSSAIVPAKPCSTLFPKA